MKNIEFNVPQSLETLRSGEFKLINDTNLQDIHNFIINNYNDVVSSEKINKIKQVKIIMDDLDGNPIKMSVNEFQNKLKTNYGQSDWTEINLNNLGTSKVTTLEGMYESIKNNLNN
jgi:hypothetical protein